MSNWIDFDMLMLELEHHRNNAARIVKAYKDIANPTDWDKLECKEAVGRVVVSECIMAWCKDFKFSSEEIKNIIDEENKKESLYRVYYINTKNLCGYDDMIPVSASNEEDAKDKVLKFLKSTRKNQDIVITKVEEE